MARLTKQTDRWFDIPDDADKARLKIRHLKHGELKDIETTANPMLGRFGHAGAMDVEIEVNPAKRLSLLVCRAIVDWQGFFDVKGKPLVCNDSNKVKALSEFDWLGEFVEEAVKTLKEEVAGKEADAEKN